MGMPGMGAAEVAAYAKQANVQKPSTMTVAELRNVVNPMTKYYDSWPAKDFIDDQSISLCEKINAIFGKIAVDVVNNTGINHNKEEAVLDMMRKAVS